MLTMTPVRFTGEMAANSRTAYISTSLVSAYLVLCFTLVDSQPFMMFKWGFCLPLIHICTFGVVDPIEYVALTAFAQLFFRRERQVADEEH